jgi:preprotein translocase subunit SecF
MQIFKSTNFNFVGNRKNALIFSSILLLGTVVSLIIRGGPNWSIDFVGGTLVQLKFEKPVINDLGTIRDIIATLELGTPEVKTIGRAEDNEVQIIVKKQEASVGEKITDALKASYPENPFDLRRAENVGAKIGGELQQKALLAGLLSLLALIIYIGFRFHFPFGVAAIIALFHDVLVTIGVFSVVNAEFSLPIVAALLTIIGYSLNDTIVAFDRIRENLGGTIARKSFNEKVNLSLNQTLSRTVITSFTTFMVVISIFSIFITSGDVIKDFALALLVGIIVGTYSSMFIASPVLVYWNQKWPIK